MDTPVYFQSMPGKMLRSGVAILLVVLAGRTFNASAQTETNLYSFFGYSIDGGNPDGTLIQGRDGNFYGTAIGGSYPYSTNDYGSVFRISPSGSFTNLHSFKFNDGTHPIAGVVQGRDGNFYGTTSSGGSTNLNHGAGFGAVFQMTPSGTLTNLYPFLGTPDGAFPYAGLVQGNDGNFYGTTSAGGISTNGEVGYGTIFRISSSGNYTNLYSFAGYPIDGSGPNGLVLGRDGNFYGTTSEGGVSGGGTIFRISSSGVYSNLYAFRGSLNNSDGDTPDAGLVQGSDGNFYGTTLFGGVSTDGTIFRISPSGLYTSLYSFASFPNDGTFPVAGLVQGSDGNFYGTSEEGGTSGNGTVFRISPSGNYSNLYSFGSTPNDGAGPEAGLVQGSDGSFYGTATFGGMNKSGTVYRLTVPLSPPPYPINQITGVQVSGVNMVFNIPSVAYETYQLQFSSSMAPTNWVNVPGVSVTNSIGALLTLTNFGGAVGPQGFYRFDITP